MKLYSPLSIIIILGTFFAGFMSVLGYTSLKQKTERSSAQISPTPTPITISLPSKALVGILSKSSGLVEKIPWDTTDHIPATEGAGIHQGDEILTLEDTVAIIGIPTVGTISLQEKSDLILSNLIPEKITLRQKSGVIQYTNESSSTPLSIRATGGFLELNQGSAIIEIDDTIVTLSISSGSAKIAYVNSHNITQVWQLNAGDTTEIDDDAGTVDTTGVLY